jgi:hypothetical protein
MQITTQANRMSFDDAFTPQITIVETDHGVTARDGNPAELLAASDARQAGCFFGDSFQDRGIPESALHD